MADRLQLEIAAVSSAGRIHLNTSWLHINSLLEMSEIGRQVHPLYLRQNDGKKITSAENISNRPTSIFQARNHFPTSEMKA